MSKTGKSVLTSSASRRVAVFDPAFIDDLRYWVDTDRGTAKRLPEIVEAVLRDPFVGIGKPEPLESWVATSGHGA